MITYTAKVIKKVACAPCATLTRLLPSLQAKHDHVYWEVIEVKDPSELEQHGISIKSFPTTILYNLEGVEIGRQPGALGVDTFITTYAV